MIICMTISLNLKAKSKAEGQNYTHPSGAVLLVEMWGWKARTWESSM